MKKFIIISGVVYMVTYVGACVYMIANPEGYGKLLGRIFGGFYDALEKEEI